MARASEHGLLLDLQDESRAIISAAPAEPGEKRAALWAVAISALLFLAALPFAKVQLAAVPAFIASYQSALVVSDLATAAILFSQYAFLGSRPLLALATGYVFTAFMAVAHALTFPGLLADTGLLGATPQTTAWIGVLPNRKAMNLPRPTDRSMAPDSARRSRATSARLGFSAASRSKAISKNTRFL